jgi:hypothetical protein
MASQKQIDANRRNAQKSTGPITEAGKAVAKFNALRHGMTAESAVLPYEDHLAYAMLREALLSHYAPPTSPKKCSSTSSPTATGASSEPVASKRPP